MGNSPTKKILPLDLESFSIPDAESFLNNYYWPGSTVEYDTLGTKNLELLMKIFKESEGKNRKIIQLKFRDIFTDFNNLISNYLDVTKGIRAGYSPICSSSSFLYKNIIRDKYPPAPVCLARMNISLKEKLKSWIKVKFFDPGSIKAKDSQNLYITNGFGELGRIYCKTHSISPACVSNDIFSPVPSYKYNRPEIKPLADKIFRGWLDIIKSLDISLSAKSSEYLRHILEYHLSLAWRDLHTEAPFSLEKTVYLSGTGASYWNKLISYKVQKSGGKVIRFDHGGERPFFADSWWGINEFVFCDEFFTFSRHAADAIKTKISNKDYNTLLDKPETLKIYFLPSENFHKIAEKNDSYNIPEKIKKVMFVPSGFRGECNTIPAFTNHDIPNADFQIQILKALNTAGFEALYKYSPKVAALGSLFDSTRYGAKKVLGYFSDCLDIPDAFVFTFIGTAFCEAMCTNKLVILVLAPPTRPILEEEKKELYASCRVVHCNADRNNRFILDSDSFLKQLVPVTESELEKRRFFRNKWLLCR